MPRGFNNWTAPQVMKFLKKHSFRHSYTRGSHFYYSGTVDGKEALVCVPVHGGTSIHPKTMKSIVRQSGIPENDWFNS